MNALQEIKVLDEYRIWLRFDDGFESIVDLKPLLNRGIALELLDSTHFIKVDIESGGGLAWENGFDVCPNSLRELADKKVHVE